jgi:hypothetical protein
MGRPGEASNIVTGGGGGKSCSVLRVARQQVAWTRLEPGHVQSICNRQ